MRENRVPCVTHINHIDAKCLVSSPCDISILGLVFDWTRIRVMGCKFEVGLIFRGLDQITSTDPF